ncbi:hypothetical protein K474DRAFT_1290969 [Panus rudis PR-1116 ss-1]|nr:hypothetical protein K474DRAFT_1290969 [Panus rudis PR-1116 ss-1]
MTKRQGALLLSALYSLPDYKEVLLWITGKGMDRRVEIHYNISRHSSCRRLWYQLRDFQSRIASDWVSRFRKPQGDVLA